MPASTYTTHTPVQYPPWNLAHPYHPGGVYYPNPNTANLTDPLPDSHSPFDPPSPLGILTVKEVRAGKKYKYKFGASPMPSLAFPFDKRTAAVAALKGAYPHLDFKSDGSIDVFGGKVWKYKCLRSGTRARIRLIQQIDQDDEFIVEESIERPPPHLSSLVLNRKYARKVDNPTQARSNHGTYDLRTGDEHQIALVGVTAIPKNGRKHVSGQCDSVIKGKDVAKAPSLKGPRKLLLAAAKKSPTAKHKQKRFPSFREAFNKLAGTEGLTTCQAIRAHYEQLDTQLRDIKALLGCLGTTEHVMEESSSSDNDEHNC